MESEYSTSSEEAVQEKRPLLDHIIIGCDSRWKSYFDVWILILVGYSCSTTLFYVAFHQPTGKIHLAWDKMVEMFFYTDFCFNFLQEYIDPDNHGKVRDLKSIAQFYIKGWFFIDFVSIFPFNVLFSTGVITKLVRLARLPRLIKLIDISRFSKLLKSFEKEGGGDDQWIVQQYFILYVYNIGRLIVVALMITYFIGCIIYFISSELNTDEDVLSGHTFIARFNLDKYESD